MQDLEGRGRRGLVSLVVGYEGPAEVGGDHFGGLEVSPREGALAGAGRADEHDQRQLGKNDLGAHR